VNQEEWEQLIAEFQAGTLSLPRFAKSKGVAYQALKTQLKAKGITDFWKDKPSEERILILEAYHRSGLSTEEFAGSQGVSEDRLREWLEQERSNGERRFHCEWKQLVAEFLESDYLTMSEFARAKNLSPDRLKYWMNRYDPEKRWKKQGERVKTKLIDEFSRSEKSAAAFAREKGVEGSTFLSWIWKYDTDRKSGHSYAQMRSEEERQALIAEFEKSGKLIKDFEVEKGIKKGTFSKWLVKHDPSRRRNDTNHDCDAHETS